MPFTPEDDDRRVAEYLGLPSDQRFDFRMPVACDTLPGWEGYRLAHWGTRVDWDPTADGEPTEWPSATARTLDGEILTFRLWLIQAYRPGYPLAAERRWHPHLGVRDAIIGLEEDHTQDDLLAAWRGHALIMAHRQEEERGREEIKRAIYLRAAVSAARRMMDEQIPPTFPLIADILAEEEPELQPETIKKRWDRRKPPILMGEVIRLAGRP
jgi:hypothetical protein